MSDDRAIDQVVDEIGSSIGRLVLERVGHITPAPESPIERMMLIGLMGLSYTVPRFIFEDLYDFVRRDVQFPIIRVTTQAPVLNYRADILLTVEFEGKVLGRVVVECDGHNFHERTKDQASRDRTRDREMTLAGFKVMRFTGSEIHRSVMNCVFDAYRAAWDFWDARS